MASMSEEEKAALEEGMQEARKSRMNLEAIRGARAIISLWILRNHSNLW